MAITAFAGPLSNIVVAFAALLLANCCLLIPAEFVATFYAMYFFIYIATINVSLAVFNLIPIPPLDGSKVLFAILPAKSYFAYMQYEQFGMILLIAFICFGAFDGFLITARTSIINGMLEIVSRIFTLI